MGLCRVEQNTTTKTLQQGLSVVSTSSGRQSPASDSTNFYYDYAKEAKSVPLYDYKKGEKLSVKERIYNCHKQCFTIDKSELLELE